ncbi:hypothetical protein [Streptomyces sp. NBC_01591]|uniref:hypothetical protein n=1 Tax=Streptomyces sp. NBC_01591 TaxID=2975888 RepID=UPI002DD8E4DF|nr:hypothetical protein [Streptomyces sp. NBC_01591]
MRTLRIATGVEAVSLTFLLVNVFTVHTEVITSLGPGCSCWVRSGGCCHLPRSGGRTGSQVVLAAVELVLSPLFFWLADAEEKGLRGSS